MRFPWMFLSGVIFLCACGKPASPDATAVAPSPTPAAASGPLPGVVPQAEDTAGSGVPGPGAGATAVGGLAGQQDAGGAKKDSGASPAPTGGDGAASAPR